MGFSDLTAFDKVAESRVFTPQNIDPQPAKAVNDDAKDNAMDVTPTTGDSLMGRVSKIQLIAFTLCAKSNFSSFYG